MSDYYNGYGSPRLIMRKGIETIILDFPICNIKGTPEEYEEDAVIHELDWKGRIVKDIGGHRIRFKLYYNELVKKDGLKTILKALSLEKKGYTITLMIHKDILLRTYEVIGNNEKIKLNLVNNRELSEGHEGLELEYITTEIIEDVFDEFIDPEDVNIILDYRRFVII